jgi:hypothetical protein
MGLGQRAGSRLQLRKQPRVLDGDHRLVGEGLEQRDLLVGIGPHVTPAQCDGADRLAVPQHGHGQDGATSALNPAGRLVVRVREDIRHVGDSPAEDRAGRWAVAARSTREDAVESVEQLGITGLAGHEVDELTVEPEYAAFLHVAQPHCVLDDRIEHWLDVGRRPRDDAQDLARRGLLFQGFGQGALHVRVRWRWLYAPREALEGRTALAAELHSRRILVLAPGAPHPRPPTRRE